MELDAESMKAKILLVGITNSGVSILLEALLREELDQYGVVSTGIDPDSEVDPRVLVVLDQAGHEVEGLTPNRVGDVIDESLRLVIYLGEAVRDEAPVIAVDCPTETLEGADWPGRPEAWSLSNYKESYLNLRDRVVPRIKGMLPELA